MRKSPKFSVWGGSQEDWTPDLDLPFGFILLSRAIEATQYWVGLRNNGEFYDVNVAWNALRENLIAGAIQSYVYGENGRFLAPLSSAAWEFGGPADIGFLTEGQGKVTRDYYWFVEVKIKDADQVGIVLIDAADFSDFTRKTKIDSRAISISPQKIRNNGGTPPRYAAFLVDAFLLMYDANTTPAPATEEELLERARTLNTDISERQSVELIRLLWKKLNPD